MFRLETFVLGVVVLEEIVDSLAEEMVSFCDGVVVVVIVVVRAKGVRERARRRRRRVRVLREPRGRERDAVDDVVGH